MELVSAPVQLFRRFQDKGQALFADQAPYVAETYRCRGGRRFKDRTGRRRSDGNPMVDDFRAGKLEPASDVIRDRNVAGQAPTQPSARKCEKKHLKTLYGPLRSPIALPTHSIA